MTHPTLLQARQLTCVACCSSNALAVCVCVGVAVGVPEDERYEGDDLEVLARAEEAEEAAPGDEEVCTDSTHTASSFCSSQQSTLRSILQAPRGVALHICSCSVQAWVTFSLKSVS